VAPIRSGNKISAKGETGTLAQVLAKKHPNLLHLNDYGDLILVIPGIDSGYMVTFDLQQKVLDATEIEDITYGVIYKDER